MRKLFFIFLVGVSFVTASCQKDETPGELIAKELQSVIEENNITRVVSVPTDTPWNNVTIYGDYGQNYEFRGEFIFIEEEVYNLNLLIRYQIRTKYISHVGRDLKFLVLTFY